jgi:hypothetical protein
LPVGRQTAGQFLVKSRVLGVLSRAQATLPRIHGTSGAAKSWSAKAALRKRNQDVMRINMKTTVTALAIAATALVAVSPAQAQWRGRHHYHHGYGGGGAALGGFAAGAILGGALAAQQPYYYGPRAYYGPSPVYEDDAVGYCASRFRSYDPRSGTYLGNDGYRHPCP